jgi:hypothetical protein
VVLILDASSPCSDYRYTLGSLRYQLGCVWTDISLLHIRWDDILIAGRMK